MAYKFVINSKFSGAEEDFTGIFKTEEEADEFFQDYGEFWKERGIHLIKKKIDYNHLKKCRNLY